MQFGHFRPHTEGKNMSRSQQRVFLVCFIPYHYPGGPSLA